MSRHAHHAPAPHWSHDHGASACVRPQNAAMAFEKRAPRGLDCCIALVVRTHAPPD